MISFINKLSSEIKYVWGQPPSKPGCHFKLIEEYVILVRLIFVGVSGTSKWEKKRR